MLFDLFSQVFFIVDFLCKYLDFSLIFSSLISSTHTINNEIVFIQFNTNISSAPFLFLKSITMLTSNNSLLWVQLIKYSFDRSDLKSFSCFKLLLQIKIMKYFYLLVTCKLALSIKITETLWNTPCFLWIIVDSSFRKIKICLNLLCKWLSS